MILKGRVLYTSRSPVPYTKKFSKKIKAKRIYGIFAFTYKFLKKFSLTKESHLENVRLVTLIESVIIIQINI